MATMTITEEMLKEMVTLLVYLQMTCKEGLRTRNLKVNQKKEVVGTINRIDAVFKQLKETKIDESN